MKGRINYRQSLGDFVYEVNKNISYILTDFQARSINHNAAYNDAITGTYRVFMQTVFGQEYAVYLKKMLKLAEILAQEMKKNG